MVITSCDECFLSSPRGLDILLLFLYCSSSINKRFVSLFTLFSLHIILSTWYQSFSTFFLNCSTSLRAWPAILLSEIESFLRAISSLSSSVTLSDFVCIILDSSTSFLISFSIKSWFARSSASIILFNSAIGRGY